MTPRVDPTTYIKSGLGKAMLALQREVETSGREHSTLEPVKRRASRLLTMTGCLNCPMIRLPAWIFTSRRLSRCSSASYSE